MSNHYVYKITNNKSTDKRKYYIGVRTSRGCFPEEDTGYWGSCKSLIAHMQEVGLERFSKEILKKFKTRKEAVNYEIELHNRYEVSTNPEYYNRSKQKVNGFDRAGVADSEEERALKSRRAKKVMEENPHLREKFANNHGENNPFYGKTHSEETRRKIGESSKGRKKSKRTLQKMSKRFSGANNPRAYIVEIYDNDGILQETHRGTFHSLKTRKGYPYSAFIKSYKNEGERIYQTNQGKSKAKFFGFEKYIGWYAKKVENIPQN